MVLLFQVTLKDRCLIIWKMTITNSGIINPPKPPMQRSACVGGFALGRAI